MQVCSEDNKDTKTQSNTKNELSWKGLCFICKRPWGPNHSCLSDIEEMTKVDQDEIPSDFSNADSSTIVESIDFQADTFEGHE